MAWNYGNATDKELSERTLSLQVKVQRELVNDVNVSNVRERCRLESARSIEVHEAVLDIPSCDRPAIVPVVWGSIASPRSTESLLGDCTIGFTRCDVPSRPSAGSKPPFSRN